MRDTFICPKHGERLIHNPSWLPEYFEKHFHRRFAPRFSHKSGHTLPEVMHQHHIAF